MNKFDFQNPVKIYFGEGEIASIAKEIKPGSKVMMTYGGGSIKRNGIYDAVLEKLRQAGKEVVYGTFCLFRKAHLFHPNICQFAVEPLGRHEHARQKAALANVLFPQGGGEVVVVRQFFCHFTQARQFHAEYQAVV